MLLKYLAIAAIVFVLLAFGLNKWKKKYRHANSDKAGGDTRPKAKGTRPEAGYYLWKMEDRQHAKAEQQIAKAVSAADKVYKASRGKAKGKTK